MTQAYKADFSKIIEGQSIEASDEQIMSEIRKLMLADTVEHPEVTKPPRRAKMPSKQATETQPQPVKEIRKPGLLARAVAKLTGYQPRWSHNLMILSLATIIYSPLGMAIAVGLTLAAAVILHRLVGESRLRDMGQASMPLLLRVAPQTGKDIAHWADVMLNRLAGLSIQLPFSSTRTDKDLDLIEPFDRLLAQRQAGQQTSTD